MDRLYGIDIGTTFITVYENNTGAVIRTRHNGKIPAVLQEILAACDDSHTIVFTGKAGKDIARHMNGTYIEEAVAASYILKENTFNGKQGKIIDIGASSLTLYTVNAGKITDITQNTLCAAGTGLFLEEQAERLHVDLEHMGILDIDDPPLIAGRCTVFAKSDLIHHQQEGRSKKEMWAGLCRSLVMTAANTLFRGEKLTGEIMLMGGVSLNKEVVRWFKKLHPEAVWLTPPNSAALVAAGAARASGTPKSTLKPLSGMQKKHFKRMPELLLKRSQYPQMTAPVTDKHHNEIRIHQKTPPGTPGNLINAPVILGMDIGSTSTKLAVLDAQNHQPLLDIYGRTAGDPIRAARSVFASLYDVLEQQGQKDITVLAFGTTGSGRLLVGKMFAADLIVNEISAHGKGTAHFFPGVETIFEIGGQDAKYIRLKDGYVADVNMNYVCAAGTGSFVEEQARKLGFKVDEIGSVTKGIAPAATADRCTVFMEQDLRSLLKEGFSREEALASVLYSVVRNYLNRVVGNRPVSEDKIFFQGATARNQGLVAALENLLGVEVAVSPFCHLMGAIGAALIAHQQRQQEQDRVSTFIGKDAIHLEVTSRTEICKLCRNFCRINFISRTSTGNGSVPDPGSEFSWGYQCGRDPHEKNRKEGNGYSLFRQRNAVFYRPGAEGEIPTAPKGTVTIVNALTNHSYFPLWKRFFNKLGYRVRLSSRQTDSSVKEYSSAAASADFCFPVKSALGHVMKALEKPDPIFLPYMIADKPVLETAHSFFCPYMESSASVVRSTLARNGISADNLLSPVIDLRRSRKYNINSLYDALKPTLPVRRKDVADAFKDAYNDWETEIAGLERKGSLMLEELKNSGEPVFLLLGRPYNLYDRGLNLGIPEKIAAMGYRVIPLDMLELDLSALSATNYHNVYWKYGQKIIAALKQIADADNVFPIYFSNFNCGPDSFLLSFAEEQINGRPMLILELDEHDSDGGYLTRIEAFLDVVHAYMKRNGTAAQYTTGAHRSLPHIYTPRRQADTRGTVWIPPMHDPTARFFAAVFRAAGFQSRHLPKEDNDAFLLGKKYLRGGECLPMTLTLGSFIKAVKEHDKDSHYVLLMPTAEGPCRFGQYNLMDRIVLQQTGLTNVDILSPSSINAYQGVSEDLRRHVLHAALCGDIMFKLLTRVRPYERTRGDADALYEESIQLLAGVLERKENARKAIREIAARFGTIAVTTEKRPLVGIVGEIYVRCNQFSNRDVVKVIEENGGEAWLAPLYEWMAYVAYMQSVSGSPHNQRFKIKQKGEALITNLYITHREQLYYQAAGQILAGRHEPSIKEVVQTGARFLPREFEGESILTVGRADLFARHGADMVVNVAPFGCMPGTLSGAVLLEIKENYDIPFVSLFYDGDIDPNDKLAALLKTISIDNELKRKRARMAGEKIVQSGLSETYAAGDKRR